MKDSEADIAIGVLNKLIDQELEAVRAATRDGNTPFGGYAQTRHNAFLYARDEIRKALATAVDERGAGNPFLPQRDELVTQDMHTCDLCGRWCSSPVYSIGLIYGGQAKTFTEVCADCMRRLKFQPAETIRRQAIALQKHISEALADLQTLSGSEDIQISHALTMATIQASKALKQAHLMQDSADMLNQADQRDEENNISRMLISKIAQQGE